MTTEIELLKQQYQAAFTAEQQFAEGKSGYVESCAQALISARSEPLGFEHKRLQSNTMIADVFNRELANGRAPVAMKNNGLSLSLIYAPLCSQKELHKRAVQLGEDSFNDALVRLNNDSNVARIALGDALVALQAEQLEQQRQQQLQDEISDMLQRT